jgi:hypothetical protein
MYVPAGVVLTVVPVYCTWILAGSALTVPLKPPLAVPEMPVTELSGEVTTDCNAAVNVPLPLERVIVLGENLFWVLGENMEGFPPDAVHTMVNVNAPPPGVAFKVGLAQLTVTGVAAT